MQRPNLSKALTTLLLLCAASVGVAQQLDYDPRRHASLRPCDEHLYRGRLEQARTCYRALLNNSANTLVRAEAAWGAGDVRRANELFREAVRLDEKSVRARSRWGRLYMTTHQFSDAAALFQQALEIDKDDHHARLGITALLANQFEGNARKLVAEILQEDAQLIEAHLQAAKMDLEEGKLGSAEQLLNKALSLAERQKQPPLEAYELLAALDLMRGDDKASRWTSRALNHNPRYGGVFETLAHYEVMRRRYSQAIEWLRRAIEVQPDLWSAQAELGVNLLRLGRVEEARVHLERAYSGDPFSPTTVNTLRLLDTLQKFAVERSSSPDILMRLDPRESGALRPYVEELTRDSINTFARRYGFQPTQPVQVELYPNHDDFAVRTAGLPGIGLLGVTFGYLVAMDSPSGRRAGEFHWGSTLWHEMAHVFTLSITEHRVPRWLSEGISVFEEWRTGPTPGVAVTPRALEAFGEGKFLPVATLDEGFIRPDYGDQIQVSYMQAGLICLFIEERWGFERLVALLRQFTRPTTTQAAVEATFKMSSREFDEQFNAFMKQRFASMLANGKEWQKSILAAHAAVDRENWSNAVASAQRAIEIFPEYTASGSPYLLLARAYEATGKRDEAIKALQRYRELGGWDPAALRQLADWLDQAKRSDQALEVLNALLFADPLDPALHSRLGERLFAAGKPTESLREYRVLLALNAHDTAGANFGIARALRSLGDTANSRRHLLEALETAPHYRPAQDMLLEMSGEQLP